MLTNLKELSINTSNFEGTTIPNEIGALSMLEHFDLSSTGLKGGVPQSIASMSNLEYLDIGKNELTGGLPDSLARLTSLGTYELISHCCLRLWV